MGQKKTDLSLINRSTRRQRKYLQSETPEQKQNRLLRQRMALKRKLASETIAERAGRKKAQRERNNYLKSLKSKKISQLKCKLKKQFLANPKLFKNLNPSQYSMLSEIARNVQKNTFPKKSQVLSGSNTNNITARKKSKRNEQELFELSLSEAIRRYWESNLKLTKYEPIRSIKNSEIKTQNCAPLDWESYLNNMEVKLGLTEKSSVSDIHEPNCSQGISEISTLYIKQEITEDIPVAEDCIEIHEFSFDNIKTENVDS